MHIVVFILFYLFIIFLKEKMHILGDNIIKGKLALIQTGKKIAFPIFKF